MRWSPIDPATQHIILKIVGFLEVGFPSFELNLNAAQQAFNPNSCMVVPWYFFKAHNFSLWFPTWKSNFEVLVGMQNLVREKQNNPETSFPP